ncbi:homogentisate 1,2-dioxygenase [Pseudonocardia ammonioxydans]|uniref:Homogentisate 1,2-dioxygenase n=1 Tax=Pseudonocardia ammonioxydans TaxID=260086 RepID=A0A1I5HQL2_PSUAM|nr:hypothetical protein [Pseudonocardia ammonioxydans]SFO50186.1 homogentisate 1,2-dioxygenase [Pseudonocardia ammonioxydans]
MTEARLPDTEPTTDLFTRNGFEGPASLLVRQQYTPTYRKVSGSYAPRRLEPWNSLTEAPDPRDLPVTILRGPRVRIEVWNRDHDTPFAVRDVHHDQLIYVLDGHARLETDFGVLDLDPLDAVLLSRSVSFRLTRVRSLQTLIVATESTLHLKPSNAAVLDPSAIDTPRPYDEPARPDGEHELIVRHGDETTSYFYEQDPVHVLQAVGAPAVQRFSMGAVRPLTVPGASSPPASLVVDPTTETMIYYLGARDTGRPPVHHNADYDEIGIYAKGPGPLGALTVPGSAVWVPKGLIHHGPDEDVPEGYIAWLIETRAHLELTEAGQRIARLAETTAFHVHPSEGAQQS